MVLVQGEQVFQRGLTRGDLRGATLSRTLLESYLCLRPQLLASLHLI